jgi:hypothetical protein
MRHRDGRWLTMMCGVVRAGALSVGGASLAVGPLAPGASATPTPSARAATRTISLNENGSLRLTSKHEFTLNERGSATGTITGTIYVHLTIVSTSRVTAEVNIYPNRGSVTGYATASYHKGSETADFQGTIAIVRGTGTYAHAHGTGLSFGGTIQRSDDAITVRLSGRTSV